MAKPKFPVFGIILLLIGLSWALNELKIISIDLPWFPIILIILAIGMIVNRYRD